MAWSKEEILALAKIRVNNKVKVGRFAVATMDNLRESNKVSNTFNILVNLNFYFLRSLLSSCPSLIVGGQPQGGDHQGDPGES